MDSVIESAAPWRALHAYISCMEQTIEEWRGYLTTTFESDWFTQHERTVWLARLSNTFKMLRERYAYNPLETLGIEPLASGFPRRYDIRILASDHRAAKAKLPLPKASSDTLKRVFLDSLFITRSVSLPLLERIAKARADELIAAYEPIQLFKICSVREMQSENGTPAYLCCFERFCHRALPTLYVILFEFHGKEELIKETLSELSRVLREETSQLPLLSRLAQNIDLASAEISPKLVGRIILGPVFVSHLTKDEHELQQALDAVVPDGAHQAASRIIYEYVLAENSAAARQLRDPSGKKHREIQEFSVRTSDAECERRGVSHVEKFLFAPHAVIQELNPDFLRAIGHRLIGGSS